MGMEKNERGRSQLLRVAATTLAGALLGSLVLPFVTTLSGDAVAAGAAAGASSFGLFALISAMRGDRAATRVALVFLVGTTGAGGGAVWWLVKTEPALPLWQCCLLGTLLAVVFLFQG